LSYKTVFIILVFKVINLFRSVSHSAWQGGHFCNTPAIFNCRRMVRRELDRQITVLIPMFVCEHWTKMRSTSLIGHWVAIA